MVLIRETAHRMFAQEFNASRHQIKGEGEKEPSYVVSPLGAKVNRLHVVGVCTDVEPVGESGEVWRARISDPTGVFTVYAGQYQPDAAHTLSNLQPPQFVAVTGKARTYEPEPGSMFVSIRPETIDLVDEASRDQWILRTAQRTIERLKASTAVRANPHTTKEELVESGVRAIDADGALLAQEAYGLTGVDRFARATRDAVTYLKDGTIPVHRIEPRDRDAEGGGGFSRGNSGDTPSATTPPPTYRPEEKSGDGDDVLDDAILKQVQELEGSNGANWEDVLGGAAVDGVTSEQVEEALNRLMDKGLVYEPTLGVLKTT